MIRRPPRSPLFPYTPLSRSAATGLGELSISVGQKIDASGQATVDSSGNVTLDATAGQVRLAPTSLWRSEEHTSELQSQSNLVCRLLLEKKKKPRPSQHSAVH